MKDSWDLKIRGIGFIFLIFFIIVLSSFCTQIIAFRMDYAKILGQPVFWGFYAPFNWWKWSWYFSSIYPKLVTFVLLLFLFGSLISVLIFLFVTGFILRSSRKYVDAHGTARFASLEDIRLSGLLPAAYSQGRGVYCGAFEDEKERCIRYLRHDGPEHICAFAPTRSGKGVGLVIPTLLSWTESVFVLDRKGENYAISAGWRQEKAKNIVLRFEPGDPKLSCCWNPLDEIRFQTMFQVSDVQNIALMLVDSDGKGVEGNHFRTAACELLLGSILYGLYKANQLGRSFCLQDCAHMLTNVGIFAIKEEKHIDADGDIQALFALFTEMKNFSLETDNNADKEAVLVISGIGCRMLGTATRELSGIISTANNALSLYRDPIIGNNTRKSDFSISDLMDHTKSVSLYFVTTQRNADRMRSLARLLLTLIISILADRMEFKDGRALSQHKHRLLMMLDEFPTLEKLDILENALAFIAGYGIKAYLIAQDITQIYKRYSNYQSIIANCHIRIAYAPNTLETAEWMSKMAGMMTYIKESISTSGKRFGLILNQVSRGYNEIKRPLMTPDEIMQLPGPVKNEEDDTLIKAGEILVFVAGKPVIKGQQILYFRDPVFSKRSKMPPPETDKIEVKTSLVLTKEDQRKTFFVP